MQIAIRPSLEMPLPRGTAIEIEFDQAVILHGGEVRLEVSDALTHRLLYGEWSIDSFLIMRQSGNPFVVFVHIPEYAFVPFAFYSVKCYENDLILGYLGRQCDSLS